jgi:thymidylate synthase (FAD)
VLYKDVFKLGDRDRVLIRHIIDSEHTSTLEHIAFNFQIKGISRLNLQELARHRMASLSVKSTRYTLKELKEEKSFFEHEEFDCDYERAAKFINLIGIAEIDSTSICALENLRALVARGEYTNDQVKYALPECYRLDLFWTINARSLQNFLKLRLSKKAHFEIRETAQKIYDAIPEEYKFLFII